MSLGHSYHKCTALMMISLSQDPTTLQVPFRSLHVRFVVSQYLNPAFKAQDDSSSHHYLKPAMLVCSPGGEKASMYHFNRENSYPVSPWAFWATPTPLRIGRRHDIVQCPMEQTVHFSRPSQVVLLPEFDKDPRYKFSSSRSIRSRKGGFSAGLGHFSIALPYLQSMREQQAEVSHVQIVQPLCSNAGCAIQNLFVYPALPV